MSHSVSFSPPTLVSNRELDLQLVGPAGCSNYSYHVISKLLVFQCLHWPLVMTGVIREDRDISMRVLLLSSEKKEGALMEIFQMRTFARPYVVYEPFTHSGKCVRWCELS